MSWIEKNRRLIEAKLLNSNQWKYFSPIIYSQYLITLPMILDNVKGNLIDIGCGRMPFLKEISPYVNSYDGLDILPVLKNVKYVCDAQNMSIVNDDTYDSAICLEVLEHTPEPIKVLGEVHRVLRDNGKLIISVPHLSRLHDLPHDYYRFTRYGIINIIEEAGFEVLDIKMKGSLFTFIGHQISTILLTAVVRIPLLREIIFLINKWAITRFFVFIDQHLDKKGIFACGYSVLAIRK
jgi:SAM-dependent methyltransferase